MNGYKALKYKITGVAPFIQHNGQLADPINQWSVAIKSLTAKGKKTDADQIEIGRLEWYGSLYLDNGSPCIPSEMLEAVLIKGAMKEKRGPAAKAGLLVERNAPLLYKGSRKPDELWKDEGFRLRTPVKVNMAKVIRTRPRFDKWSAAIEVSFLPSLLNEAEVTSFLVTAGEQIGIGDWRPRFGRFVVERA